MSRYNKALGDFGEAVAAEFLETSGCMVIARNYRSNEGELDLIAKDDTALIFVEVKTRSSERFGQPAEAVTPNKQKKIVLTAKRYLSEHPTEREIRFDIIEVYASHRHGAFSLHKINHIQHAILEVNE